MNVFELAEFHPFEAAGQRYLYLVPSAAVFRLDEVSAAVIDTLTESPRTGPDTVAGLASQFGETRVKQALVELAGARAVRTSVPAPVQPARPPRSIPLQTLVLNVTSKCNLACKYCYEYGEDKIPEAAANPQPRFMSEEVARQSVDFAFDESKSLTHVHITFFGGETLLNYKVLKTTAEYAKERARTLGKTVDFSLTTNATLLKPDMIEWLSDNDVGVTVSIDGGKDEQDSMRVFSNGKGSYDVVLPRIKALLARHRGRPVGARVTLTKRNLNVLEIFRHLTQEIGFHEVGFAPVTTSWTRDWAIEGSGYERMLDQFDQLAYEFRDAVLAGGRHGFSNVRETLQEIHKGMSKAYPCGAGIGLMGVATDGDVALCHRFAASPEHELGSVFTGIDRDRQEKFLDKHHVAHKGICQTCWARPICAGGCYHEAHTRYGNTAEPNLHYCNWIRRWTDTCLRVYGELAERRPAWLNLLAA